MRLNLWLVLFFAVLSTFFDWLAERLPGYSGINSGGYFEIQRAQAPVTKIVVIDIHDVMGSRSRIGDPQSRDDPRWVEISKRRRRMAQVIDSLALRQPKAIVVDWQLALRDEDLSAVSSGFDQTVVPPEAAKAYRQLIDSLVRASGKGIAVVVGADWVREQRLGARDQWFLNSFAADLGATLQAPDISLGDYIATSYCHAKTSLIGLPSITDILAQKLGGRLTDPAPPLFSPYASQDHRQFWMDFGLAPRGPIAWTPEAGPARAVSGKIVFIGPLDRRDVTDSVTIPGRGISAGVYHHAAATATRLYAPVYAPASQLAGLVVTFVIALLFGLLALFFKSMLGSAHKRFRRGRDESGDKSKEGIADHAVEALAEAIVLGLALAFAYWQLRAFSQHRMLFPMAGANLASRFIEVTAIGIGLTKKVASDRAKRNT